MQKNMQSPQEKPLLLTQTRNLLLRKGKDELTIEEFPQWLAESMGKSADDFLGQVVDSETEMMIPGLTELIQRTVESDNPVKGYKTGFMDISAKKHQLLLDSSIRDSQSGEKLIGIVIQEIPLECLPEKNLATTTFCGLIGASDAMQNVFNKIRMYSVSDAPVLITGETGAGKEGVAQAIHKLSERRDKAFITMNCSAITETLFESELFGHEKGSFTGAIKSHRGRFERADGGTLFLDEIGDLPLSSQAKLLRVLETSQIEKVGSEKIVDLDVRIVAATNHDLERSSIKKTFRSDLFYRINALQIKVPPLRKRPEDVALLIQHFIGLLNLKYNRNVVCLTHEALQLLKQYQWPGNIRELRNLMERLFAENKTEVIGLRALKEWYEERREVSNQGIEDEKTYQDVTVLPYKPAIPLGMDSDEHGKIIAAEFSKKPMFETLRNLEQTNKIEEKDLRQAYRSAEGNITKAAEALGIHKATFYRHLKNLNLSREDLE